MRISSTIYNVAELQLGWDWILIRLGLNNDQVRTNSAMTHVLVLSVKGIRNEWLKWVDMVGSRHC